LWIEPVQQLFDPRHLFEGGGFAGETFVKAGELFKQVAGIDVTHVPYKGAAPAMMDLRGGRVSYMGTSLASANQLVREGKIRAIATTGVKRARLLPDVPTVAEQGYSGFESVSWLGMLAPARVPRAIIDRLEGGRIELLRRGEAFWEPLERTGVRTTIIRMPANFPPSGKATRELSGMGTPDLLGTYGIFSFFTSEPFAFGGRPLSGASVVPVDVSEGVVRASIEGPDNPFLVMQKGMSDGIIAALDAWCASRTFRSTSAESFQ
jgi:hypothetical protein